MSCQIESDTHITDTRWKWAKPARMHLKYLTKFARNKAPFQFDNRRIKAFNMPNGKFSSTSTSHLNKMNSFLNSAGHGLLNQDIDTAVKDKRGNLIVQVSRYNHRDQVWMGLFHHFTIIGISVYVKAPHCAPQRGFVHLRYAYQQYLLLVEIP